MFRQILLDTHVVHESFSAEVGQAVTIMADELAPAGIIWDLQVPEGIQQVAEHAVIINPTLIGGPDLRIWSLVLRAPGPHVVTLTKGAETWTLHIKVHEHVPAATK